MHSLQCCNCPCTEYNAVGAACQHTHAHYIRDVSFINTASSSTALYSSSPLRTMLPPFSCTVLPYCSTVQCCSSAKQCLVWRTSCLAYTMVVRCSMVLPFCSEECTCEPCVDSTVYLWYSFCSGSHRVYDEHLCHLSNFCRVTGNVCSA